MVTLRTRVLRLTCGYFGGHLGIVVPGEDRVTLFCTHCGYESKGIDIHAVPVRQQWMRERQRLKWAAHRRRWTWMKSA